MLLLPNFAESQSGIRDTTTLNVMQKISSSSCQHLLGDYIASLDFDPNGEMVATIDNYGVCLLSDVTTNNYSFHLKTQDNFQGLLNRS